MREELIKKIKELKKKRKAVILAHNYQPPHIQEIADFVGDSLGLSVEAKRTKTKVIVFCGVYFMAETAKILSPQKTVLIPEKDAGCPLADKITAADLIKLKKCYPQAKVLCYVNTPAEVKAESDYCCTSANAVRLVNEISKSNKERIIFVPDKHLASYVSPRTKKRFIVWKGFCPVHVKIRPEDIKKKKKLYPEAEVFVHPECIPEVIRLADRVLSTEGMCKYAQTSKAKRIIVGTEVGIIYRLRKENPDKEFFPANEEAICADMKKISLKKVLWALENMQYQINLSREVIRKAQKSIKRMLFYVD
ncbi:MAG: quinolinate synthase NadA [Candidatus Omnitrophica bacterium]|nr:quinolinate synthase NadA [Candidatus Omnitrophota bacterium]